MIFRNQIEEAIVFHFCRLFPTQPCHSYSACSHLHGPVSSPPGESKVFGWKMLLKVPHIRKLVHKQPCLFFPATLCTCSIDKKQQVIVHCPALRVKEINRSVLTVTTETVSCFLFPVHLLCFITLGSCIKSCPMDLQTKFIWPCFFSLAALYSSNTLNLSFLVLVHQHLIRLFFFSVFFSFSFFLL